MSDVNNVSLLWTLAEVLTVIDGTENQTEADSEAIINFRIDLRRRIGDFKEEIGFDDE